MRPLLRPRLVNDPFGDPGLYLECLLEKRALLFDLGDLQPLAPRELLRVSHVFVSHAHMDHFSGFDRLLRACLGREKEMELFGPPGFVARVEHKLASYTWNLVSNFPTDFTLRATEAHPDGRGAVAEFHCRRAFRRESAEARSIVDGILLDEDAFRVRTATVDHDIPCLAFAIEEKSRASVWKNRLEEMGLGVGPWLSELKRAVLRDDPDETPIRARWREGDIVRERDLLLGELKARLLRIVPGQKFAYVVDAAYHERNVSTIVKLARGADVLFIEACFLDEDTALAAQKRHLTARQAGLLARAAEVKRMVPFHFSPRYAGMEERLRQEAEEAFFS